MPSRDEILRTHTFKEDGLSVGHRVFYTLNPDDKSLRMDRNAKALSILVEKLHEKGLIDEEWLDDFLFQVAYQ